MRDYQGTYKMKETCSKDDSKLKRRAPRAVLLAPRVPSVLANPSVPVGLARWLACIQLPPPRLYAAPDHRAAYHTLLSPGFSCKGEITMASRVLSTRAASSACSP